jgi:hypothetical protein
VTDERPITQWDGFRHPPEGDTLLAADSKLPSDPPLPTGVSLSTTEPAEALPFDPISDIGERLATLSDAVLSPEGLLHRLFGALERRADLRHQETMRALTHVTQALSDVANNQVETLARLNKLEPTVEEHEAHIRIVRASNGNGHDHGHAIDP